MAEQLWEAAEHERLRIIECNIVMTCSIGVTPDLETFAHRMHPVGAAFNPRRFVAVILKLTSARLGPDSTVTLLQFGSGKVVCTGGKHAPTVAKMIDAYVRCVREVGGYARARLRDVRTQNIVGKCDYPFLIDLDRMNAENPSRVVYDGSFPGARVRMPGDYVEDENERDGEEPDWGIVEQVLLAAVDQESGRRATDIDALIARLEQLPEPAAAAASALVPAAAAAGAKQESRARRSAPHEVNTAVVLVFGSGRMVVPGTKTRESLVRRVRAVAPLVRRYAVFCVDGHTRVGVAMPAPAEIEVVERVAGQRNLLVERRQQVAHARRVLGLVRVPAALLQLHGGARRRTVPRRVAPADLRLVNAYLALVCDAGLDEAEAERRVVASTPQQRRAREQRRHALATRTAQQRHAQFLHVVQRNGPRDLRGITLDQRRNPYEVCYHPASQRLRTFKLPTMKKLSSFMARSRAARLRRLRADSSQWDA